MSNKTTFTCPLTPVSSSPEQRPPSQQDQGGAETENSSIQNQINQRETATNQVQEMTDSTDPLEQTHKKEAEEEEAEIKSDVNPFSSSNLHPSVSAEERTEISIDLTKDPESKHPCHHCIQRCHPPRGSHLTKRDQKIIEKIRSYYEAAAEAEEEDGEEEEEQRDEVPSRRRKSFSQIPTGLVKESVSRFSVGEHHEEPVSIHFKQNCEEPEQETESSSSAGPTSISVKSNCDEGLDQPIPFLNSEPEEPVVCDGIQDQEAPTQAGLNAESGPNRLTEEETEILDRTEDIYGNVLEERVLETEWDTFVSVSKSKITNLLEKEASALFEDPKSVEERKTSAVDQTVSNGHALQQAEPLSTESSTCLTQEQETQMSKAQPTWSKNQTRNQTGTKENLKGFNSQIKVGRWSRHSKIVTANRALFEGMASDVTGIGLFESNPVVDPVLMENSERILSKVQTLAQMFSGKASTMKVMLHQKQASTLWTQSWRSARLTGRSTWNQDRSSTQHQMETDQEENKPGPYTKAKSLTSKQTRQQSGKAGGQNQVQTMTLECQRVQEEMMMMIKKEENQINGGLDFMVSMSCFDGLNLVKTNYNSFFFSRATREPGVAQRTSADCLYNSNLSPNKWVHAVQTKGLHLCHDQRVSSHPRRTSIIKE